MTAQDLPLPEDLAPALHVSEARLAAMFESAMDGIVSIDHNYRVVLFNQAAERMFRCTASAAMGQTLDQFLPQRFRGRHAEHIAAFGDTGVTTRRMGSIGPISGLRADGEEFPIEASISQVELNGQKLYTVILRDVTERVHAERRLREQQQTLSAVIDAASDAVVSVNADSRITLFNPAAERIFGRPAAQMLGQPLETLMPGRFRAAHSADLQGFARSQVTRRAMGAGRVKGLNAEGDELELEASISQAMVNGRLTLTAILRDVTQRVRAETALLKYQFELSELAQQLMTQEKTTTRRLAQALHDQLGQTLTAIRLTYDAALSDVQAQAGASTALSQRISGLIDQAVREVRQVLVDLRPPLLDANGLAAALANETRSRHDAPAGLDLLLEVEPEVAGLRWPADVEYACFMVAREAMANAIRHAGASLVRIVLSGSVGDIRLEVVDDGQGIAPDAHAARPGHLGMVGMRERALAIGARFEVVPAEGGGTVMRLEWANSG
jgi:PAS domain S-box-containing protein